MPCEITTYQESLAGELIAVYNRETATDEFVVPLTPHIWTEQVASKPLFSPDGCFLTMERGRALGFALTSPGEDPGTGVVDGLFFPADRLEVGVALLAHCMDHLLHRETIETVYGFASYGGYPYWRGLYCGAEPVCPTRYTHAWVAFMARGFAHHQQSINYLGVPEPRAYRRDLTYTESDLDSSSPWDRQSWKGHRPRVLTVQDIDRTMGHVGYVELPFLSAYRGKDVVGIYSLRVQAPYGRRGIATALLSALVDRSYERGVQEILAGTTVGNTAAQRTYEKVGIGPVAFRTGTMYRREARGKGGLGRVCKLQPMDSSSSNPHRPVVRSTLFVAGG